MNIILFDDASRKQLLPLTFTRPVAEIRIGMLKISEKWARSLNSQTISFISEAYLQKKFPLNLQNDNYFINGSVLPNAALISAIKNLAIGEALLYKDILLAKRAGTWDAIHNEINFEAQVSIINSLPQIFSENDAQLRADFLLCTEGRKSAALSGTNTLIGDPAQLFLEEGAIVEASVLNTNTGPIYISKDAEVMENCSIRGPFYLGEHSQTKMATKIYGATTIGPYSKVGGELNNVVIFGYSNKAHDGFLGNAVIGEWCNLGADSNNSNLKNNYAEVKLWNYHSQNFKRTGLQFCGLVMADHAKCGINTMFNTGTVVGVGSNVFGAGFPRNFIPDFSWGGAQGMETFALHKMMEVAHKVFERRGIPFDATEQEIISQVFELTQESRKNYE
jgi:UDP-N-acetylglucosamine diphosphorylase/glucosamine-1-phosphate N-acetyltransferase